MYLGYSWEKSSAQRLRSFIFIKLSCSCAENIKFEQITVYIIDDNNTVLD
jgi:hypothetical protein